MPKAFAGQVSLRFGPGKEHLLNIQGDSIEELAENCGKVEQLASSITQLGEAFNPPTEGAAVSLLQRELGAQVVQQDAGRMCTHGMMTFKDGVGKTGKKWSAYFCPHPSKNQQCDPIWS